MLFVLSYLEGGEAEKWKQKYVKTLRKTTGTGATAVTTTDWPTEAAFWKKFTEDFKEENKAKDALIKLEELKQGNQIAEEMTTEF